MNAARLPHARREPVAQRAPLPRFELEHGTDRRPGVYWIGVDVDRETHEDRAAAPVWICSPLHIRALTRDQSGSEWGRLLEWTDADGRRHRWAMPCELLAGTGEELRAALLRGGVQIASGSNERRRLVDYISWERPEITAQAVNRTGWHGPAFVWPDRTEGDSLREPVFFQSASTDGLRIGSAGTLDSWRAEVAERCAGNSRLVLALSAAFAGPCVGLAGADGGGIHYRGPSSTGKSTALRVAASVYGGPDFVRSWRATDNGLEGTAALHTDLLLCLDELGELPARVAGATAYMLANGVGKSRAARDGSPRATATWRVLFLSSGEVGLGDLISEAGGRSRAGQDVRILDLPADAGAGLGMFEALPHGTSAGRFAEALTSAASTHYGHAGRAFIGWLVDRHAEAREQLRRVRDALAETLAPDGSAGQVRRVAARFALIAAAGELATDAGLTGWQPGEASRAAAVCFRAWLASRGTTGAAEPAAMIAQVRGFLEAHGESRFSPAEGDAPRTINRAGFRRQGPDGDEFLVLPEVFRSEVCRGFDFRAVARALADVGALMLDADGTCTRSERLPGIKKGRVYRIGPAIWSASND